MLWRHARSGVSCSSTYADLRPTSPVSRALALPVPAIRHHVDPCYLAENELTYVGEPWRGRAESRAIAEDAATGRAT